MSKRMLHRIGHPMGHLSGMSTPRGSKRETCRNECFMGLGTLWATLQDLIPCEVRNAKRVQTNAPQAWAPMRGTLFGGGPCRGGLFELNGPPRQGVWAATTTIAMVRRIKWRPPLLYVNPLSHSISATLKISQKCVKQQPKNERAVRARCARCVCFPHRHPMSGTRY